MFTTNPLNVFAIFFSGEAAETGRTDAKGTNGKNDQGTIKTGS